MVSTRARRSCLIQSGVPQPSSKLNSHLIASLYLVLRSISVIAAIVTFRTCLDVKDIISDLENQIFVPRHSGCYARRFSNTRSLKSTASLSRTMVIASQTFQTPTDTRQNFYLASHVYGALWMASNLRVAIKHHRCRAPERHSVSVVVNCTFQATSSEQVLEHIAAGCYAGLVKYTKHCVPDCRE